MKICGIYKIINKLNGKFYIGSSVDIKGRFYNHKSQLDRNIHNNKYLQNSWNKHGGINFEFFIIKECNCENLISEEQDELNAHYGKDYCYNLSPSADVSMRGIPRSEEAKKKMSDAQRGKPRWTFEQKIQMSIERRGRKHSPETIMKFRGRQSGYDNIKKAQLFNIGRVYTQEHRNAISIGKINANRKILENDGV